ncbi:MAG: GNAT family N-acetyltransferase [Planctomycetales bacterium]|nr:GNAT family N-acetyltransferase [Planctomycetales bacterium]
MKFTAEKNPIRYEINHASEDAILEHLRKCSPHFRPPLQQRVDLADYAQKLASRSVTMESWADQQLVGLVAAYLNPDSDPPNAFISNVSVLPEYRSQGIAKRLLDRCHHEAGRRGIQTIRLEVTAENKPAIALYMNLGYFITGENEDNLSMQLDLGADQ